MARTDRIPFSSMNQDLSEIADHYRDVADALRRYYHVSSVNASTRFVGYSPAELSDELRCRLEEVDLTSTLSILAATEAVFRIDYLQRCYQRKKDALSRSFRYLYAEKRNKASLEEDILSVWKREYPYLVPLIGELKGAFKYRHWLAHGRYWEPILGQRYDYLSVYQLAETVMAKFRFEKA